MIKFRTNWMDEKWSAVPEYDGRYQVSTMGRIMRARSFPGENAKIQLLKQGVDKDGYLKVNLSMNKTEKRYFVHRLVLRTFCGEPVGDKDKVNHLNGIKNDNRLENLEWCSNQENMNHANRTGLFDGARCQNHYKAKLSNKDILSIRREYMKGDKTLKDLGKKYKVAFSTIGRIISKATWKNI